MLRFLLIFSLVAKLEANKIDHSSEVMENEAPASGSIIRRLIKRVGDLEARDKLQTQFLETLERNHQQEIDQLKSQLIIQKEEISILRKKSFGQDRLISKLLRLTKQPLRTLVAEPETGKDGGRKLSVNRIRRAENEETVAFTVGLTHRFLHAGAHQNIVFDHVETNIGNGYNSNHGVFTAPVPGLYVFYTSILADNDREVWCDIVVNGKNKASVYARGTDTRHDQGSQLIITQLQQGDDVAVQNIVADDAVYGDPTIYSTFSGYLLQQDFSDAGNIVG